MKFILSLTLLTSSMAFAEIGHINKDVAVYKPARATASSKKAEDFVGECKVIAVRELRRKLKDIHGARLEPESVTLMDINDTYFNPVKTYFWMAEGIDQRGDVISESVGTVKTLKSWRTEESKCQL
jgi:hypothetical protein